LKQKKKKKKCKNERKDKQNVFFINEDEKERNFLSGGSFRLVC